MQSTELAEYYQHPDIFKRVSRKNQQFIFHKNPRLNNKWTITDLSEYNGFIELGFKAVRNLIGWFDRESGELVPKYFIECTSTDTVHAIEFKQNTGNKTWEYEFYSANWGESEINIRISDDSNTFYVDTPSSEGMLYVTLLVDKEDGSPLIRSNTIVLYLIAENYAYSSPEPQYE